MSRKLGAIQTAANNIVNIGLVNPMAVEQTKEICLTARNIPDL